MTASGIRSDLSIGVNGPFIGNESHEVFGLSGMNWREKVINLLRIIFPVHHTNRADTYNGRYIPFDIQKKETKPYDVYENSMKYDSIRLHIWPL